MLEDGHYFCECCGTEWEFLEDVLNCPCAEDYSYIQQEEQYTNER